jgi:hypothetical protein
MILGRPSAAEGLLAPWRARWQQALAVWSRFTKLAEPRWCLDAAGEKEEQLAGSFAMIRLQDHAVVISLRQVEALGLADYALPILAHEIGHHVYAPADLRDNARLLTRVKAGLPSREALSGMIANLYTDLLINDRLQRDSGLDMAAVYRKLRVTGADRLWRMYMRIYEVLWSLEAGSLALGELDARLQSDAALGARLVRAYAKDWLEGAGRFAALMLPYLLEAPQMGAIIATPWADTGQAGAGDQIPDGLAEIGDGELEGAVHPAEDEALSGLGGLDEEDQEGEKEESSSPRAGGRAVRGGHKNRYRSPSEYRELMQSLGVDLPEKDFIIRYYRERALPHLIRFPVRRLPQAVDPQPEGLDQWDAGNPLSELDWVESLVRSPRVIPGVTTVQRTFGLTPGHEPERLPMDLFLGVDCSGSMGNPAYDLSYPVLAGAIIVLSALRVGARVKVTLSGEPGEHSSTEGFIRDEREIMKVLTGYLGTGYAFGILRLKDTFLSGDRPKGPVHILIVTDQDIFHMLKEVPAGWELAREALQAAGGGGTYVLNIASRQYYEQDIARMEEDGWQLHLVSGWEELVAFARAFARASYEEGTGQKPGRRGETR